MNAMERIRETLSEALNPTYLEVVNESSQHNVPKGSETHVKVIVVSPFFAGMSRVARQQKIYELLKGEIENGIHALAQRTYSPEEWTQRNEETFASPECRHKKLKA